jgi:hypothetical protein
MITIEKLRSVEWGRSYLWEVVFPTAPPPYNEWFPATSVTENLWSVEMRPIELPYTTTEIPGSSSAFGFTLGYQDDANHTLTSWFEQWVNEIMLPGDRPRLYVSEMVRPVMLLKYQPNHELLKTRNSYSQYWVLPKGEQNFEGSNQSDGITMNVDMVIMGVISHTKDLDIKSAKIEHQSGNSTNLSSIKNKFGL